MNLSLLAGLLALSLVTATAADMPADPRASTVINRDWTFNLGDVAGAEAPAFDDRKWTPIGLPHSFSMPQFAATKNFYVGYGWYRKILELSADQVQGKRLALEFEGAFQDAEVFVNGTLVTRHQGGYTGFSCDITAAAKPGRNVVAVRLNNLWNPRLAPRAGEHVFSGGIYRDVSLVTTDLLHVAWCGTFVTTPQLTEQSGTVQVSTEVRNDGAAPTATTLISEVVDDHGTIVGSVSETRTVPPGETLTFTQTTPLIATPKLWDPEHPNLYRVISRVQDGKRLADRYETTFGFRTIAFTADQGFFLNGKHRYFHGANVHQDQAGWGDAVANSAMVRDVQMMKDAGMDIVRGSHYPHDPAFAAACDSLGMLFWSENCFWGTGGRSSEGSWSASAYPVNPADEAGFERSIKNTLREMIRIHRNHPSIIVWSMSNEAFFSGKEVLPKVRNLLKQLVAISHELDPTRPAAIGGCQRGEVDKLGDIAGYNGDGAKLFINPGVPSVISEYGSTISDRPGAYHPGWGDLPLGGKQDMPKPYTWRYPWRSGEIIWCGFDHASIAGRTFGGMGLVDYFRLPKRQWFWYRNEYLHIPPPLWPAEGTPAALTLTASTTTLEHADGTCDAHLIVTVVDKDNQPLANNVPVTLSVVSGPGELPTGPAIIFEPKSDIAIRDGQAAISFRSFQAGITVLRASSPGLKDATITLTSKDGPVFDGSLAIPRPYSRFDAKNQGKIVATEQIHGQDNPTGSSGDAGDHPSRLANDGNPATWWIADHVATGVFWQVNLERFVTVRQISLTFPDAGAYRVRIETTTDGTTWTTLAERSADTSAEQKRIINLDKPQPALSLRVVFTGLPPGKPAALAEFTAAGVTGE